MLSREYFEDMYRYMGSDAEAALNAIGNAPDADPATVFPTVPGTESEINLYRITVYDNLPNAPANGIYVAVDFDNRIGNVANHCGYLMWHSIDAREFSLGRVEGGSLTEALVEPVSGADATLVRKKLRCSIFYD